MACSFEITASACDHCRERPQLLAATLLGSQAVLVCNLNRWEKELQIQFTNY